MSERMTTVAGWTIVLSYAASQGLDLDALCRTVEIDPARFGDPLSKVPFTSTERLWREVIARLPDQNVGVGIGTVARSEHYGYMGQFLNGATHAVELLQMVARSAALGDTGLVDDPARVILHPNLVELRLPALLKAGIPERAEAVFIGALAFLRRTGTAYEPVRVHAAHSWDPKREIAARSFGCQVVWNSEHDAMFLDRARMFAPLPGAQPNAGEGFDNFMARKVRSTAGLSFVQRVRTVVESQVARGDATQQAAADALGTSVRTLQRELQQEGLRYGDVLGDALKRVATELMHDCERSLDEIAQRLGYSDVSSFSRSWKRLTGESPARYRTRLLGKPWPVVGSAPDKQEC